MPSNVTIETIRSTRRTRLRALLEEIPAAELARRIGIDPNQIYQMANAEGKSARNVSDARAESIETAAGKPHGWLSGADDSSPTLLDRELMRRAILAVERQLPDGDPETKPNVVLGTYDMLVAGASAEKVSAFLDGMKFAWKNPAHEET